MGWYDRAIYALESRKTIPKFGTGISPMPHQSSVVQYSRQAGIDPWAYGIMRQESRLISARVQVLGQGLMQIMRHRALYRT